MRKWIVSFCALMSACFSCLQAERVYELDLVGFNTEEYSFDGTVLTNEGEIGGYFYENYFFDDKSEKRNGFFILESNGGMTTSPPSNSDLTFAGLNNNGECCLLDVENNKYSVLSKRSSLKEYEIPRRLCSPLIVDFFDDEGRLFFSEFKSGNSFITTGFILNGEVTIFDEDHRIYEMICEKGYTPCCYHVTEVHGEISVGYFGTSSGNFFGFYCEENIIQIFSNEQFKGFHTIIPLSMNSQGNLMIVAVEEDANYKFLKLKTVLWSLKENKALFEYPDFCGLFLNDQNEIAGKMYNENTYRIEGGQYLDSGKTVQSCVAVALQGNIESLENELVRDSTSSYFFRAGENTNVLKRELGYICGFNISGQILFQVENKDTPNQTFLLTPIDR